MSDTSPRNRLSKLFNRKSALEKHEETANEPPPSSPHASSSPSSPPQMQRPSSRSSFRNFLPDRLSEDQKPPLGDRVLRDRRLPDVPHVTDLSSDLQHLTVRSEPGNEDVANHKVQRRPVRRESPAEQDAAKRFGVPPDSYRSQYGHGGLERPTMSSGADATPAPLKMNKKTVGNTPLPPAGLQKAVGTDRLDNGTSSNTALPTSLLSSGKSPRNVPRTSLDKALPLAPREQVAHPHESEAQRALVDAEAIAKHDSGVESHVGRERGYLIKDGTHPIDLAKVVNLNNSEDTTLSERWAPAVTHEKIIRNVHEIREERITREIHTYDIHHRILPVIDIEVLPARHFIPVERGYAEISEAEVPGRAKEHRNWVIAETISKMVPQTEGNVIPRHFTARKFEGAKGDDKEYVTPRGVPRTETTWVHPPTLETGGQRTGQTYPFHFGSEAPEQDGLRAKLPPGAVIGSSVMHAQQQSAKQQAHATRQTNLDGNAPPPVPLHKQL